MTEDEWLRRGAWPERVLLDLHSAWRQGEVRLADRKLRLFCCACCRRVETFVGDERVRRVIRVAEDHVDGLATNGDLRAAGDAIEQAWYEHIEAAAATMPAESVWLSAPVPCLHLVEAAAYAVGRTPGCILTGGWCGRAMQAAMKCRLAILFASSEFGRDEQPVTESELGTHLAFLHDCLGNPFRPVPLDTAWLAWAGGAVPNLAQAIYAERAFERMPILADALEEAGCTNAEILDHCRGRDGHVRGCWLVDSILART
jgi:hypothetical protein